MKILSAVKIECPNVVRITEGPYCRGYFYRKYSQLTVFAEYVLTFIICNHWNPKKKKCIKIKYLLQFIITC